jgi:uncharacterized membrane protein
MIWLTIFGLISLMFILVGTSLALKRVRRYRQESEARRARAFTEMMEIVERKKTEDRRQSPEQQST